MTLEFKCPICGHENPGFSYDPNSKPGADEIQCDCGRCNFQWREKSVRQRKSEGENIENKDLRKDKKFKELIKRCIDFINKTRDHEYKNVRMLEVFRNQLLSAVLDLCSFDMQRDPDTGDLIYVE